MFKITVTETSTNKPFGVVYTKSFACVDGKCIIDSKSGDVHTYDLDKYSIDVSNDTTEVDEPYVGQIIYVPTSLYVYRGRDDFQGGKAIISSIKPDPRLPDGHYNKLMISIQNRESVSYNWNYLKEQQGIWKEVFGDNWAHPDPDLAPDVNNDNDDWK